MKVQIIYPIDRLIRQLQGIADKKTAIGYNGRLNIYTISLRIAF